MSEPLVIVGNGMAAARLVDELVPGIACGIDDVVIAFEDTV